MAMSTEKKVGLFFLLSLIALAVLIEFVEDIKPFQQQVEYVAFFDNLIGLNEGDPVRLAGVQVGKVKSIDLQEHRIRVLFAVREGTAVKSDSHAKVRQTNLLGGQFLGLSFGSPTSEVLPPGAEVPTLESTNIDQMLSNIESSLKKTLDELSSLVEEGREQLTASLKHLESVLKKTDQGEGTLGRLINDPELYDEIQQVAGNLNQLTARLERGEGTLGRLLTDEELYRQTTATLENLKEITARLRAGEGTLGQLLASNEIHDSAADALAQIREIAGKANRGEGTLGKLVNDETLYVETTETMTRVNSIATKIDEGQGTVGRLINEDDLYRDVKTTLNKVEKTVDGLSDSGPLTAVGTIIGTLF